MSEKNEPDVLIRGLFCSWNGNTSFDISSPELAKLLKTWRMAGVELAAALRTANTLLSMLTPLVIQLGDNAGQIMAAFEESVGVTNERHRAFVEKLAKDIWGEDE